MLSPKFRRLVSALSIVGIVIVGVATAASAHIDPSPIAAQAGTATVITFNVEHGCAGSPTTALAFQIPPGVLAVRAVDKPGWQSNVTATEVDFTGGSQDAGKPTIFAIAMTIPTQPGSVSFNIQQTCVAGETAWVEATVPGKAEPGFPAAVVKLTAGPPTAAELTPATDPTKSSSLTPLLVGIGASVAIIAVLGVKLARSKRPSS